MLFRRTLSALAACPRRAGEPPYRAGFRALCPCRAALRLLPQIQSVLRSSRCKIFDKNWLYEKQPLKRLTAKEKSPQTQGLQGF